MAEKEQTLEKLFTQLEDVIREMEQGEVSLEEAFELYHKGVDTLKMCNEKIDKVKKKILVLDNEGETHEFEQ